MVLRYIIEKEFKQMFRDGLIPRLIFIFPCLMMLLMPWAANMEIKYNMVCVVDNDHTMTSRRLVEKVASTDYFTLTAMVPNYSQALQMVGIGEADVILEIPRHFERDLERNSSPVVQVSANAINGTKGGLGVSYMTTVVTDFCQQPVRVMPVSLSERYLFNPQLDYKHFMVPALMVMLLTILCGFLPTLNIVSEKERGTMEQLNVTPLGKFTFILGKLFPYWVVGMVVLTLCILLSVVVYQIRPMGSLGFLYLSAAVFILVVSGLGLMVSNHSSTMQQSMFVMFFFILVLMLMSGLFTPVRSMPLWAQWVAAANPLTYFIEIMRSVYLKGSHISDLFRPLGILVVFAVLFDGWAVLSYRKTNR